MGALPETPRLVDIPLAVHDMITARIAKMTGDTWIVCKWATYGDTQAGMQWHRDEAYQGGSHTLLVYLTDWFEGGHTVFDNDVRIAPSQGKAVLSGIRCRHTVEPASDMKIIFAFEVYKVNVV